MLKSALYYATEYLYYGFFYYYMDKVCFGLPSAS